MAIGKLTVCRFNSSDSIFETDISDITISGGKLFASIGPTFRASLPIEREKIYTLIVTGIDGQDDITMTATFQEYSFSAGTSSYVDGDGVERTGVVTLSNRLQFGIIS